MLKRRYCAGLSLFGTLLATGLLGIMVVGALTILETRRLDDRARVSARQLAALTEAVNAFVNARFPALLAASAAGPFQITLDQLRIGNALPPGFANTGALGRGYRILVLADGPQAFRALVTQTVPDGDTLIPGAGLLENVGQARLGLVFPDRDDRLSGPVINADIADFQAAFPGQPSPRALATLLRFDHQTVFGDQLYRVAVPGFADANRMETDLDLGGNAIANVGRIEAGSLAVTNDLTAMGDLDIDGELLVGQAIRVTADARIAGMITAGSAAITGALDTGTLAVSETVHADTVMAEGSVTAGTLSAVTEISAETARLGNLQTGHLSAATVNAGRLSASETRADLIQASGHISAATAGFSRLTVGSCSGC